MKTIGMIFLALMLAGCLNLKIKSELPNVDVYDLSVGNFENIKCKKPMQIALLGIVSSDIYNTKNILKKSQDGRIEELKSKKWADLPKNMLRDLLIREGQKQCLLIALPPFGTTMPQKSIRLDVLSFVIVDGVKPQAELAIGYEIDLKKGDVIKGVISNQESLKDNDIQALQNVSEKTMRDLIEIIERNR